MNSSDESLKNNIKNTGNKIETNYQSISQREQKLVHQQEDLKEKIELIR